VNLARVEPDGRVRLPSALASFFSVGERIEVTQHRWHLALWRAWRGARVHASDAKRTRVAVASMFERASRRYHVRSRELRRADTETAMYLSGYALECRLKKMICERYGCASLERAEYEHARGSGQEATLTGAQGHDLQVLATVAGVWPRLQGETEARRSFQIVSAWQVAWRYDVPRQDKAAADAFFTAVDTVMLWLEGK
jgi:hypothetical protein